MMKDEKDEHFIQGCIDSLTSFDETKREQTHYKQIIKDSFSYILAKNSKVSQKLFLDVQLSEMAMHMRLLDLKNPKNCRGNKIKPDKKTMYMILSGSVYMKRDQGSDF